VVWVSAALKLLALRPHGEIFAPGMPVAGGVMLDGMPRSDEDDIGLCATPGDGLACAHSLWSFAWRAVASSGFRVGRPPAAPHAEVLEVEVFANEHGPGAPIPASSGKTSRHRLNPGGDRQATVPCTSSLFVAFATANAPAPMLNAEPAKANPSATSRAASSATSPARSTTPSARTSLISSHPRHARQPRSSAAAPAPASPENALDLLARPSRPLPGSRPQRLDHVHRSDVTQVAIGDRERRVAEASRMTLIGVRSRARSAA